MSDYLLFASAFLASAIAPGADTLLIATRSLQSRGAAIWSALGITAAKLTMVTVIFFGVSSVLQEAAWLIDALRVFGVGFLLYRAWVLWQKGPSSKGERGSGRDFATGFSVGFANPQPFAFYLSIMPAVIGETELWGLLAIVATGFALVSAIYIAATVPMRAWLESGESQKFVNRVLSVVFVLLALWIALR